MQPTRRQALGALAGMAAVSASGQKRPRNIIFILTDDHRYNMFGCMGHPWLKTPGLDRLVHDGVLFRNAFVTTSLCSPSRASILTGLYAHAHGIYGNSTTLVDRLPTFPKVLQKAGYRTALMGKWHMGGASDMPQPGFDRWVSFRGQGVYNDPEINFDGTRRQVKGYVTDILTEEALRFIGDNASRPFMLYLGHKGVHDEFIPAERHKHLYSKEPVPHPATMADTPENYRGKPDWVRAIRGSIIGVDGMYDHRSTFDDFYRDYCRTLMAVDESTSRILDTLGARGLLDDTLIVYMGDNGFLMGEHGLIDKRNMYEPSLRVPMIAHCPSLFGKGRKVDQMALNIDIAPTVIEAAGLKPPASMHGRSLLPLATSAGPVEGWRKDFLYEYFWERGLPQTPTMMGLRTEQYSYTRYHGTFDRDELYDIKRDPEQTNNLLGEYRLTSQGGPFTNRITDPELKKRVIGFQARMERILRETGGAPDPLWSVQAQ